VLNPDVPDLNDVWVADPSTGLAFAQKAPQCAVGRDEIRVQELDRNAISDIDVAGFEHAAHATGPELAHQDELAKPSTDPGQHDRPALASFPSLPHRPQNLTQPDASSKCRARAQLPLGLGAALPADSRCMLRGGEAHPGEQVTTGPSITTPNTDESAREAGPSEQPYLYLVLECDQPNAGAARYGLAGIDEIVVGRGPARGIRRETVGGVRRLIVQAAGRYLSSLHARIHRVGSDWYLEDVASTNGSFVNAQRISERRQLRPMDLIELGHKLFMLSPAESTASGVFPDCEAELGDAQRGTATLLPSLAEHFAALKKIATTRLSVLLLGETGTGKELVALALHELSGRGGPFVPVNCGALTATLAESQLFGHVKGAFSGALRDEPGFLRSADGGTVLLDEIADLPEPSQPILLRVLQDMRVVPVGSVRAHQLDIRIVSATHKDVSDLEDRGTFRRDLLARLNGVTLRLPSLRERKQDLGLLIATLLARHYAAADFRITPEAAWLLFAYDWPANIRGLEQCLLRACALGDGKVIRKADLPAELLDGPSRSRPAGQSVAYAKRADVELELRQLLTDRLNEHRGNVSEVARSFGKARVQIQRWLRRFNLRAEQFRK
jgi:sigma-54 dependent transcriptional regulator, acetoin dehydrogenase operon transcriptional activator AcoR